MRRYLFLALFAASLFADAHLFVYHRFGDDRFPSTNTSVEALRAQFDYFKRHGYVVIPLSRLNQALSRGEPIDERWVVLTIDDAYKSFYEHGLALFREYGYAFTLFVPTEAVERGYGDYMNWEQIRQSAAFGELGLHSHAHPHLVSLSPEAVRADTERAMTAFQRALGAAPRYYAYPYGEYDPDTRRVVESFGFDLILNQSSGAVAAHSDPHDLDRIALTGNSDPAPKLAIESLEVEWIEPTKWPDGGKLKFIHAKIPSNPRRVEFYASGHGWKWAEVDGGELRLSPDLVLEKARTRLFLKSGNKQSSIILVKE